MNLRVIKPGILDTVQDLGRYGWQHLGINPGGAMDRFSAQIVNLLVDNKPAEATIELHFPAAEFFFETPALIAVGGADFSPHLNGEEIPCWQPVLINKYSILQFYGLKDGARAYLAVHGGLNLTKWLGSHTTHLKASVGGYEGRALRKDDEIGIPSLSPAMVSILGKEEFITLPWKADTNWNDKETNEIMLLKGNEWEQLDIASKEKLESQPFTISKDSDRMGYHLQGDSLSMTKYEELVSAGVSFGTVQLLPDGQLILLMADHQTTGGYPRIGHVISSHLPKLAQMTTGHSFRFRFIDTLNAEQLLIKQHQHLLQLQNACTFRLEEFMYANQH